MKSVLISIGNELLNGHTTNSNAIYIATELNKIGINLTAIITIGDNSDDIHDALMQASMRAPLIFLTGGLGPTNDDITKKTLCTYFDSNLVLDIPTLENIKQMFALRGWELNELNKRQAMIPHNCIPLKNELGTAPGMWFEKKGILYISLPGVPFEMKNIFEKQVIPKLKEKFKLQQIIHKTILTTGIGESSLSEKISDWENNLPPNINLAYLPEPGIVKLRLTSVNKPQDNTLELIENEIEKLKKLIPEYIFGYDEDTLPAVVGTLLKQKKLTLSTAESCTGGQVARLITSVPGCSAYFYGSVIAYHNQVKINVLGVEKQFFESYGAVSEPVVTAMASGAKNLLNTDFAIATSGIAGPDGGTNEKPVGTVWIALAAPEKIITEKLTLGTNREVNILRASLSALNLLRKYLQGL